MARITNADKSEVLRSITIDEYDNEAIFSSRNGNGTLSVSVKDPKREERKSLREFIEGRVEAAIAGGADAVDLADYNAILDEIAERDEKATESWGEKKEKRFAISFWLDPDMMAAIANVYDNNDLSVDVRSTIREALSGSTNTRGF